MEAEVEKQIEKPIKKRKKIVIGSISFLCLLVLVYFGVTIYFMNHFYYGSEINGINMSGKTVEMVNQQMAADLQAYTLNLKERGDKNEQIKAHEIGLKYNSDGEFKNFKANQNPYKWISALFNTEAFKMTESFKYDSELLMERVERLSCFDSSNIIEPKNASLKNADNSYVIVDEVAGNKVDKAILYEQVSEAVLKKETSIDLEAIDCYVKPQFTSSSQKIINAQNMLNKYMSSKITYTIGQSKEILDGSTISTWLRVDDNFQVIFDEGKVKDYIDILSNNYNTIGKRRKFATSSGGTINIGGGDYGWSINRAKETEALLTAIKEGQTIEKEPAYTHTALAYGSNDIGNTYVEINLTKQHLWFYKNGALITQGDVVTGNVSANNTTPAGIYKLKYKEKDAVLNGVDYASPVTFWMPFNGGVGIHDASWRNKFGGAIYKTDGSHGCINSPYNLAKVIFENIKVGTPVVCYN